MVIWIIFAIFSLLILGVLIAWVVVSHDNYDRTIKPGDRYSIGNRTYKLPKIKARSASGNKSSATDDTQVYILKDAFLSQQRDLLIRVSSLFKKLEIPYWLSGGSLLGFIRHETFIPWDDDMDIHTTWEQRKYLYSKEFTYELDKYDLESIYIPKIGTYEYATKEGAAVRLRIKGTHLPVCDIFFEKSTDDNKFVKIDSWSGVEGQDVVESTKERFNHTDLFPLQFKTIDDIELSLPANPQAILEQQYGKNVMNEMIFRHPMISHQFPFRFLSFIWYKR